MPMIPGFVETCDRMVAVHKAKNDDYAESDNPFSNFDVAEDIACLFKDERDKVFATMIGIKIARIANLLNKNGKPNNESIEDTFTDLANYVVIFKSDRAARLRKPFISNTTTAKANTV